MKARCSCSSLLQHVSIILSLEVMKPLPWAGYPARKRCSARKFVVMFVLFAVACVFVCRMQAAVITALGGKPKEVITVDLRALLVARGLERFHPECTWPPAAAARELAGQVAALKKKGVKVPFPFTDLKK